MTLDPLMWIAVYFQRMNVPIKYTSGIDNKF